MSENIYEKFNAMVDIEGLKADIESAASKDGDYVEVPHGDYEVRVTKLELGQTGEKSKVPGSPMAKIWFEILAGEYKGSIIFMNQVLTTGFGIHNLNTILKDLESGVQVVFENFKQYGELLEEIFAAVDGKAEYQLSYGQNKKGYNTYAIVQKF